MALCVWGAWRDGGRTLGLPRATAQLSLFTERQAGSTGKEGICGVPSLPCQVVLGAEAEMRGTGPRPRGWDGGRAAWPAPSWPRGHVGRGFLLWKRGQSRCLIHLFSSHLCFPACATCRPAPAAFTSGTLRGAWSPGGPRGREAGGTCSVLQQLPSPRPASRTFFAGPAVRWGEGCVLWTGRALPGMCWDGAGGAARVLCLFAELSLLKGKSSLSQAGGGCERGGGGAGGHPSVRSPRRCWMWWRPGPRARSQRPPRAPVVPFDHGQVSTGPFTALAAPSELRKHPVRA